jgi:hypothetical protein
MNLYIFLSWLRPGVTGFTIDETGDNLPEGYDWRQSELRLLDNAATTPEQLEQIRRNGYVLLQRAEDGRTTLKTTKPPARRQLH